MRNINDFQSIRLNLEILSNPTSMKYLEAQLSQYLDSVRDEKFIFLNAHSIIGNKFPLNLAVLRFECDPPKVLGVVLGNQLYQIYITSGELTEKFNRIVIRLLSYFKETYLFCFGNQTRRFITQILPFKVKALHLQPTIESLYDLKIINIQLQNDEGFIPALFSIGARPYNEIPLKDNHNINLCFNQGQIDTILEQNMCYVLSILKLVKTRYLKLMLW